MVDGRRICLVVVEFQGLQDLDSDSNASSRFKGHGTKADIAVLPTTMIATGGSRVLAQQPVVPLRGRVVGMGAGAMHISGRCNPNRLMQ